jgi:hypothetical protein
MIHPNAVITKVTSIIYSSSQVIESFSKYNFTITKMFLGKNIFDPKIFLLYPVVL